MFRFAQREKYFLGNDWIRGIQLRFDSFLLFLTTAVARLQFSDFTPLLCFAEFRQLMMPQLIAAVIVAQIGLVDPIGNFVSVTVFLQLPDVYKRQGLDIWYKDDPEKKRRFLPGMPENISIHRRSWPD